MFFKYHSLVTKNKNGESQQINVKNQNEDE